MSSHNKNYLDDIKGRVILVTGAARGLGLTMALGACKAGAIVMLADVDEQALNARELRDELADLPTLTSRIDISDLKSCQAGVEKCLTSFGRIDVLINNAGRGPNFVSESQNSLSLKFWESDPARWAELIQTNIVGTYHMAHCVTPSMLRQHFGRIINISTSLSTMYRREGSPYGVSKAAIETETMIWARDLEGSGITVNALLPGGAVDTDFVSPSTREAARAGKTKLLDASIMIDPLLWLASNASSHLSGARVIASQWGPQMSLVERIQSAVEAPVLRGTPILKKGGLK